MPCSGALSESGQGKSSEPGSRSGEEIKWITTEATKAEGIELPSDFSAQNHGNRTES